MMRLIDQALGWLLVLLGGVHNFVVAPRAHDHLDADALWFVAGGLALWYAGFLNLLRARESPPSRPLAVACLATNGTLLGFVSAYVAVGERVGIEGAVLVAAVAALTVYALAGLAAALREGAAGATRR